MAKKKISVVELNKKEEKIVLEENQSPLLVFWRSHRFAIFLTLFILAFTILGVSIFAVVKNLEKSEEGVIKQASLDTSLEGYSANIATGNNALTHDKAKEKFNKDSEFKLSGEVFLVKTIDNDKMTIKFYSDGTAIRTIKSIGSITRVGALTNGGYGVTEDGVIYANAVNREVTVTDTKKYPWGTVTYYSDGSAIIEDTKINMFVRDAKDINDNYISNDKVSYIKETKKVGNNTLNYYYDGTIEVIKDNKSYVVRDINDLDLSNDNVSFKNNNAGELINSKKLADDTVVDYYSDGGAIIRKNGETISVRKSNSIVIKDNKLTEIVSSKYVTISSNKNNVTYYTNGGAVFDYNGLTYYTPENSDIKFKNNNQITNLPDSSEKMVSESNTNDGNVKIFEKTAVVTTDKYTAIVPSDDIMYDVNGNIKELNPDDDDKNSFTITNNTNEMLNYRIVIEKSPKTNLDVRYIRYQLSTNNEYVSPTRLDANVWGNDAIAKSFKIQGTNYILLEGKIDAHAVENVSIMLWTDYDTIPNSMQNKYFYGTIKVYAWSNK